MYSEIPELGAQLSHFHLVCETLWCKETCSASLRDMWSPDFPSFGQCFVTALAVQKCWGGEVWELHRPMGEIHFYNRIDGKIVDLTSEQFGFPVDHSFYNGGFPSIAAEKLKDNAKRERWRVMQSRMDRWIKDC